MKAIKYLFISALIILASCKPTIEEFKPASGDADFTKYISVGNSLTAGYTNGALYKSGQEFSYPNIIATRLKTVGGGEFKQPLMADDYGIGASAQGFVPKLILDYSTDCLGVTDLAPVRADVEINPANLQPVSDQGPFNNIGVPGLAATDADIPGYGMVNPYYGRFMSAANNSVLDEIAVVDATFFTLWLGHNEILNNASSGGNLPIVPVDQFIEAMGGIIDELKENGAKGAIGNVTEILDTPFFNTVPYNALVLTDQAMVDQLNQAYHAANQVLKLHGYDTIAFSLGPNPLVISDSDVPIGIRQIKENEKILLTTPADSIKCGGWGSIKAIEDNFTLDEGEIDLINGTIQDYNAGLALLAIEKDIALVNVNEKLKKAASGEIAFEGVSLTNEFVTGNTFSLDGLHLTPVGAAAIAYFFIEEINTKYNANIPQVIVSDYPAVEFP